MQDFFDGVFDDLNVDNIIHRFADPAANTVTFLFIALGWHVNNFWCILNVFWCCYSCAQSNAVAPFISEHDISNLLKKWSSQNSTSQSIPDKAATLERYTISFIFIFRYSFIYLTYFSFFAE